jgi:hypothetical protein
MIGIGLRPSDYGPTSQPLANAVQDRGLLAQPVRTTEIFMDCAGRTQVATALSDNPRPPATITRPKTKAVSPLRSRLRFASPRQVAPALQDRGLLAQRVHANRILMDCAVAPSQFSDRLFCHHEPSSRPSPEGRGRHIGRLMDGPCSVPRRLKPRNNTAFSRLAPGRLNIKLVLWTGCPQHAEGTPPFSACLQTGRRL